MNEDLQYGVLMSVVMHIKEAGAFWR